MVMKSLRDGASGGVTKFILMGFMALAVGGLVLTDVGGFFRGGVGGSDVAKVGDQAISIQQFDSTLRRTLQPIGMSTQDAYQFGYVQQVLSGEIRSALLQQAAKSYGVQVSDARAAAYISDMVQPLAVPGQNTKDVFKQILRAQGMRESDFVQAIKRDIGNNLVVEMVGGNFELPSDAMIMDLYKHAKETRSVRYIPFFDSEVETVEQPKDDMLRGLYEDDKETYAVEETRRLKLVRLDTDKLRAGLSVSDEDLAAYYQDNISAYSSAKSWSLDQAIVPTQELADKVYKAAESGAPIKEAVEDITGNTSAYVGAGAMHENEIVEAIKPAVLALEAAKLLAPVKSPLGWHVVRVQSINEEHVKSLDEVREDIIAELTADQLVDQTYALANDLDDLFASGAGLDDVQDSMDVQILDVGSINEFGVGDKMAHSILNEFSGERDRIIETGFTLLEGESSAIQETADGEFYAVHLAGITPKSYRGFEDVRPALLARYLAREKTKANKARVQEALSGAAALKDLANASGKSIVEKRWISRSPDAPIGDLAVFSVARLFDAPLNELIVVDIQNGQAIAQVTDFDWPDIDMDSADYLSFKAGVVSKSKEESLQVYLEAQQGRYGAMINTRLLDQVYGASAETY